MTRAEILERIREVLAAKLFDLAGTPITVGTLLAMLVLTLFTFVIAAILRRGTERFLRRRKVKDEGTVTLIGRLVHYVILFLGLATALHTSGVNLSALFAAGAVFAVAIGFAMQNITQNFVSGVILLMERSIKPGDIIEVNGYIVRVKDMGIRVTVGRTLDDEDLVIPNGQIAQSMVKNYTLKDRLHRIRVVVGVEYGSDLHVVRKCLETAAAGLTWRSRKKEPVVILDAFGASSVDYEVSCWIEDPWDAKRRRSDLREAIWWAFKEAGVVIAFPQIDVHADEPLLEALKGRGSAARPS